MHGNGSFFKFEAFVEEGAVGIRGIPAVVEGGIGHGVIGGEGVTKAIGDGGDASFVIETSNLSEPVVASFVVLSFEGVVEVAGAPESGFFDSDGIVDDALANLVARAIDATGKEKGGELWVVDAFLLFVVEVVERACDVVFGNAKVDEFGVNGGFVFFPPLRSRFFSVRVFGTFFAANSVGDSFHEKDDTNFITGGDFDPLSIGVAMPPDLAIKVFDEGLADTGLED